jgi:hypothetical protein
MKEQIGALTDAFEATDHGDFAIVANILERAISKAATPGQEVGILLQQARALEAQGRISEAATKAERAVELLRPAKPCAMLSEALFHLGMYQTDSDKARQFFTDAAAECFLKSERLLQGKLDRESIVLQGNLAQRRGQVAFFGRDFKVCGVEYSKVIPQHPRDGCH